MVLYISNKLEWDVVHVSAFYITVCITYIPWLCHWYCYGSWGICGANLYQLAEYSVYECKISHCNRRRTQNVGLYKSGGCSGRGLHSLVNQQCFVVNERDISNIVSSGSFEYCKCSCCVSFLTTHYKPKIGCEASQLTYFKIIEMFCQRIRWFKLFWWWLISAGVTISNCNMWALFAAYLLKNEMPSIICAL